MFLRPSMIHAPLSFSCLWESHANHRYHRAGIEPAMRDDEPRTPPGRRHSSTGFASRLGNGSICEITCSVIDVH